MYSNDDLKKILEEYHDNIIGIEKIISLINDNKQGSDVVIDHSRKNRCGFPEFIFGAGKTVEQLSNAIDRIADSGEPVLVTRLSEDKYLQLKEKFPQAIYDSSSKVFIIRQKQKEEKKGIIAIITAGTSDVPIAMEAKYTAELCNCTTKTFFDIGVAGIHRLFNKLDEIKKADVIICAAGMEGALPSVVAGLVSSPVIAIPTSVGYGTSLNGLTAMFAMLNSCANGVTVVNIDNGFGAGCAAVRIINRKNKD